MIKIRELMTSDAGFQEKFNAAAEAYTGPQEEKSVFENLLLPLGKEYGLSGTYEEFKEITGTSDGNADGELSEDELANVAGGKNSSIGLCAGIGIGDMFGVKTNDNFYFYACEVVGVATFCPGTGA